MTARTQAQYTRSQILERCICITIDDLLSRGANASNPKLKHLNAFIDFITANDCGAHLLEWPDGTLELVVSHRAREFSQLTQSAIVAAYRYAIFGYGLIYCDY